MPKSLQKNSMWLILAITSLVLEGQNLDWTYLFQPETDQFKTCYSSNVVIDNEQNLIFPVIEANVLKLYKCSADGVFLASLNTNHEVSWITDLVSFGRQNEWALAYSNSEQNGTGLIKIDKNLKLLIDTIYASVGWNPLSRSSISINGTMFISGHPTEGSDNHRLLGLNEFGSLTFDHSSFITPPFYGSELKSDHAGQILVSFQYGSDNEIQSIRPETDAFNWRISNPPNNLDYKVAIDADDNVYYLGSTTSWVDGQRHDTISLKRYNAAGSLQFEKKFAHPHFAHTLVEISDLEFDQSSNSVFFSLVGESELVGLGTAIYRTDPDFKVLNSRFFPHSYNSRLKRSEPISAIITTGNGNMLLARKYIKDDVENGNIALYHLGPDLATLDSLDFNISKKNSDEIFTNIKLMENNSIILYGYTHHPSDFVIDEEIEYFIARISFDSLLSNNQVLEYDKHQIALYPNPAKDKLHILTDKALRFVRIYSVQGELLKHEVPSNPLDISSLSPGVYYLEILWEKSTLIWKFVKI